MQGLHFEEDQVDACISQNSDSGQTFSLSHKDTEDLFVL